MHYPAATVLSRGRAQRMEMLESILTYEEEHIDWLEAQRDQIKQMGIENYLVKQTD